MRGRGEEEGGRREERKGRQEVEEEERLWRKEELVFMVGTSVNWVQGYACVGS